MSTKSSNIKDHKHCCEKNELTIIFSNGSTYIYHDVSKDDYDSFCGAKSLGSHLHATIKPKRKFTKI